MAWRNLFVSHACSLSRKHGCIHVSFPSGTLRDALSIPFDDIAVVVLDHTSITLTHGFLAACGEEGVSVVSHGSNHHPNGLFIPYGNYYMPLKRLQAQINLKKGVRNKLWADIVRQKIRNQALCMELASKEGVPALKRDASKVLSGDKTGRESKAAATFFKAMFGNNFTRRSSNKVWINSSLNYGYAIQRAATARVLAAHGFVATLGIHHRNQSNAFNLADDIMESYRPVVDFYVHEQLSLIEDNKKELTTEDKAGLVRLLDVVMGTAHGDMPLMAALDEQIGSIGVMMDKNTYIKHLPPVFKGLVYSSSE